MAETEAPVQRPLSPHLQIYRLTLSMVMSVLHRITGLGLIGGMILLTWWLLAAAAGQNAYATFEGFASSWLGRLILFVIANAAHMKVGVQIVIEDYVYDKNQKLTLLMLNNFFAWAVALACVFAILKISFGV